jgi:hypothetical protein
LPFPAAVPEEVVLLNLCHLRNLRIPHSALPPPGIHGLAAQGDYNSGGTRATSEKTWPGNC